MVMQSSIPIGVHIMCKKHGAAVPLYYMCRHYASPRMCTECMWFKYVVSGQLAPIRPASGRAITKACPLELGFEKWPSKWPSLWTGTV